MSLAVKGPQAATAGLASLTLRIDRRRPVAEQVYEALRAAIVAVQLEPGEAISENALVRQFGVSRTPIRAAIQRLSEEGLIDVFPQKGSFVAPVRLSGIRDSHFVRRALEVVLLREVAEVWSEEKSRQARSVVARQAAMIDAGDDDGFHAADERFHALLAEFVDRQGVWATIFAAKSRLTRLIRLSGSPTRLPRVVAEHLAILDALDAGDAPAAEAALVDHLDKIFTMIDDLPQEARRQVTD